MATALWIEFGRGMDEDTYAEVTDRLGLLHEPPDGLIFHSAGPDGRFRIMAIWDTRLHWDRFYAERVGPVMAEVTGENELLQEEPPTVQEWTVTTYHPGPGPVVNAASL